jgi:hypothetical protein
VEQSVAHWLPVPHRLPAGQAVAARQTLLPSQRPLDWLVPAGQLATHAPSAAPAGTAEQVPGLPLTLQDWQSGHLAEAQQTPSTQWSEVHSSLAAQVCPLLFWATQTPPAQKKPAAHEVVHEVAHWVPVLHT